MTVRSLVAESISGHSENRTSAYQLQGNRQFDNFSYTVAKIFDGS